MVNNSSAFTYDNVAHDVTKFLTQYCYIEEKVTLSMRLDEELGLDKETYRECLESLEEEYANKSLSFSLISAESDEAETVNDLVDLIWREVVAIVGEDK